LLIFLLKISHFVKSGCERNSAANLHKISEIMSQFEKNIYALEKKYKIVLCEKTLNRLSSFAFSLKKGVAVGIILVTLHPQKR